MNKFSWDDMELCRECHFKNENPDLCNSETPPVEKPCPMNFFTMECGRYLRESKWQRMNDEQRKEYELSRNKLH